MRLVVGKFLSASKRISVKNEVNSVLEAIGGLDFTLSGVGQQTPIFLKSAPFYLYFERKKTLFLQILVDDCR